MSGTSDQDATEVKIDRLTLDIPGLDAARAAAIAERVGFCLADLALSGERERISVTLAPFEGADEVLAAQIVAALRERLA